MGELPQILHQLYQALQAEIFQLHAHPHYPQEQARLPWRQAGREQF